MVGAYMTGLDEKYVSDTRKEAASNWFKAQAVKVSTFTASSLLNLLIKVLFKNGQFDITLQVTDMWRAENLKAKVLAEEGEYTWAFVKAANLIYTTYQATKSGEKTELSMQQINEMLTAKMKAKIHG